MPQSDPSIVNPAFVMPRNFVNSADNFRYICGEVTFVTQRKAIIAIVKKAYHLNFGCKIGDQDKYWALHICCRKCATNFSQWLNDKRHTMPFAFPMVWREPSNHTTDCYFCMAPPVSGGITKKKKWTIVYPNIPSALRTVPHVEGISVPQPPKEFTIDSDDEDEGGSNSGSPEPPASTQPHVSHGRSSAPQPHILTEDELNDIVHDLELSKSKAELLGSRLKEWNLLEKNVRISSFRSRHQQLVPFFRKEDDLVFCYTVDSLMNIFGIKHEPQEWRLIIDSSKLSLKVVSLHNGNQYPSIPVGQAVHMKETYENLKQLLNKLEYSKYGWHICGDLKVVSLLMGLQLGYMKYCWFLCDRDSQERFCIT